MAAFNRNTSRNNCSQWYSLDSNGPFGETGETDSSFIIGTHQIFNGYELLLLRKLQSDPILCERWKEKLVNGHYDVGEISHNLWFLAVTLDKNKERFLQFIEEQFQRVHGYHTLKSRETLLGRYLCSYNFTELHLDGIFKYGDDNTLPTEIFKCPSVRWLSLKYNYLDQIPCDIGRMSNLEYLALTNNKLQNKSIPYALTFCTKLKTLMLDNNLLDALPGFLLKMVSLETVHRHGNHNYFKSTFMWYHTDVNERILPVQPVAEYIRREPDKLQFWAAKAVIGSKLNFFTDCRVAPLLKDYIANIYRLLIVCGHCNIAKLCNQQGYKVITFKNPYLGNTCVPFQHWACSHGCAASLEIPAREEQIAAARELDRKYDNYIRDCQRQHYDSLSSSRRRFSLRRMSRRPSTSSTSYSISVTSADSLSRCYCPEQSCCASFWCCGRRACKCSQCIS